MSFPRYPSYKESGVEWLGQVPEHWEVVPLKAAANVGVSGIDKKSKDDEERIRFLGTDTVYSSERITASTELEECTASDDQIRSFSLHAEDVVITKDSVVPTMIAVASYVEQSPARAVCGYHLALLRSHPERAVGLFLFYSLKSTALASYFLSAARGTTIIGIGAGIIGRAAIPLPPVQEQTAIAEFLDRETGKIDELVAEQRRLMELLKEKRQAVISHAVTRGLNPAAPLKPSGIEWLGDVPAHWTVVTVRRIVDRIEQGWSPDCFARPAEPEEWGVVKSGCVNRGVFVEEENKALPENLEPVPEYEIHEGDVLMSRASGSPELVGSTAYIHHTRPKLMLSDKIFRIHLEPQVDKKFFVAVFNSRVMRSQIERAISGADGLANNLPQSAMKTFFSAIPPLAEQEAIVAHLEVELGKFDTLTAEAQRAIDLLQERRTALISAAVTGQIDVRAAVAAP